MNRILKYIIVSFTMIVACAAAALFVALFLFIGWNHGVVAAVSGAKDITVVQAWCLTFFILLTGNLLKGVAVSINEN